MNEIFSLILTIALIVAAIFTGMVAYDDGPEPHWVKVTCTWAFVLLVLFLITLVF